MGPLEILFLLLLLVVVVVGVVVYPSAVLPCSHSGSCILTSGDFSIGVCHVMKITTAELFNPNVLAQDNNLPIMSMDSDQGPEAC